MVHKRSIRPTCLARLLLYFLFFIFCKSGLFILLLQKFGQRPFTLFALLKLYTNLQTTTVPPFSRVNKKKLTFIINRQIQIIMIINMSLHLLPNYLHILSSSASPPPPPPPPPPFFFQSTICSIPLFRFLLVFVIKLFIFPIVENK